MPKRVIYKLRDSSTGLYSTGGWDFQWNEGGKTWDSLKDVGTHLKMLLRGDRYHFKIGTIPASWEVVAVEVQEKVVGNPTPATSLV